MSFSDIPGKVTLPRQWPLAVVIAAVVGMTLAYAQTNGRVENLERSMAAMQLQANENEKDIHKLAQAMARLEEKTGAILETVRRLETVRPIR
jgi:predicted  nucleic acid-binding Zn-ribbon protein